LGNLKKFLNISEISRQGGRFLREMQGIAGIKILSAAFMVPQLRLGVSPSSHKIGA
jgi:hypothetical protein